MRTYEQCLKAVSRDLIYIATDNEEILNHCLENGVENVIMTSENCLTGTDRVAEFSKVIDADYYINVQGDEPLINPDDILKCIRSIEQFKGEIINGYSPVDSKEDYESFSIPKVVFREDKRLLYMSRAPIPGNKTLQFISAFRQICIYAFPKESLTSFIQLKHKTYFENIEDIEILRFLEMGFDVRMIRMTNESIAVDTPADVEKVLTKLKNKV